MVIVTSLLVFFLLAKQVNILRWGFEEWRKAYAYYQAQNNTKALEKYEQIEPILNTNGDYLMNYGKALSVMGRHKEAIGILEHGQKYLNTTIVQTALGDSYLAQKSYHKAEECYSQASYMIPHRFYPKYLLAKLFEESGQKERAKAMASEILGRRVKINSVAIEEMKSEMRDLLKRLENSTQ
ncbi:MAG: hypothetical protein ORN54_14510 [Cyclobacteriaceae bacterium]|nr:hypothetical protein [Cyclobacteriaceae bacterium]